MANRMRKATIKQKRPIASDRANPKIAYENNCCFRDGFLQERRRGQGSRYQISVMKLALRHGQETLAPNSVMHDIGQDELS